MYKQGKSTIGEKPTQMRRSHGWNYSEGGLKGGVSPMFDENKRGARLLRIVQQRAAGATPGQIPAELQVQEDAVASEAEAVEDAVSCNKADQDGEVQRAEPGQVLADSLQEDAVASEPVEVVGNCEVGGDYANQDGQELRANPGQLSAEIQVEEDAGASEPVEDVGSCEVQGDETDQDEHERELLKARHVHTYGVRSTRSTSKLQLLQNPHASDRKRSRRPILCSTKRALSPKQNPPVMKRKNRDESCKQVTKENCIDKQVPKENCRDVQRPSYNQDPKEACHQVPLKQVPGESCRDVKRQSSSQVPMETCYQVPLQRCKQVSKYNCKDVQRQSCNQGPGENCHLVPHGQVLKENYPDVSRLSSNQIGRGEDQGGCRAESGEVQISPHTPLKRRRVVSPSYPRTPVMLRIGWTEKVYGSPDIVDKPPQKMLIPDRERQSVPMDLTSPAKSVLAPETLPEQEHQQDVQDWLEKNDFNNNFAAKIRCLRESITVGDDVDQASVGSGRKDQGGLEQIFHFFPGSVVHVEYLGASGTTEWDERELKTYYFLAEGSTPQCLRAGPGSGIVSMRQVMDSVYHRLRLNMEKPFLTIESKVVDLETPLSLFNGNSAFLIHDTQIPDKYRQHNGKLWQCWLCHKNYIRKGKFRNVPCLNSKKDDRHKYFFYHDTEAKIPDSWGNQAGDRKGSKPWACPKGHTGPRQRAVPDQVQVRAQSYEGAVEVDAVQGVETWEVGDQEAGRGEEDAVGSDVQSHIVGAEEAKNMLLVVNNEDWRRRPLVDPAKKSFISLPGPGSSSSSRPARKAAKVDYTGMAEEEEGILTDSEDDYVESESEADLSESESEADVSESESEVEIVGKEETEIRLKRKNIGKIPEDDGLCGDSPEVTEQLFLARVELRNMMEQKKQMRGQVISGKYIPDEEDMQLIEKFLCAATMEGGSKWRKHGRKQSECVKQVVKSGKVPGDRTNPALEAVAYTVVNYKDAFIDLMGLYQEELAKDMPWVLQEGKLHLRQLFQFKSASKVPFPGSILHLLRKMTSANKQKHALAAFKRFVQEVFNYLSTTPGKALFQAKTRREQEKFPDASYEADYQTYVEEQVEKVRTRLQLLGEQLKVGKPYQEFQGTVLSEAEDKRQFKKKFMGTATPLAKDSVGKYLESDCTLDLYKTMEEWTDQNHVPTPHEILWVGRELSKRWHLKQGHRPQWINLFKFKHWHDLLENKEAVYPCVLVDKSKLDVQGMKRIEKVGEVHVYHRQEGVTEDSNIEVDPMRAVTDLGDGTSIPIRDLVTGYSVKLGPHKVQTYDLIVWLSQLDVMNGRMYEELRSRFLLSLPKYAKIMAKDPEMARKMVEDSDTAFFVNSKGGTMGYHNLNYTDFSILSGCGQVTPHIVRKMQSQFIETQGSTLLKEARQFMLAHSEDTDRRFYQDHLRMEELAKIGQATYRAQFKEDQLLHEEGYSGKGKGTFKKLPALSEAQKERDRRGAEKLANSQLVEYLKAEETRDAARVPTFQKLLGNREKLAMFQMVIDHINNRFITNMNNTTADVFLKGGNLVKLVNMKYVMRMLLLSDPSKKYSIVLRESLLKWVELSKEEDLRKLEWSFVTKLVNVVMKMGVARGVGCKNLLHLLTIFNRQHGNQYFLDNASIFNELVLWQAQDIVRFNKFNEGQDVVEVCKYMQEARKKLLERQSNGDPAGDSDREDDAAEAPVLEPPRAEAEHGDKAGYTDSPKQPPAGKKFVLDDNFKLKFLKIYILHAPDLFVRAPDRTGKACYLRNLRAMEEKKVGIELDGDNYLLKSVVAMDTLAQYLSFKGFSNKKSPMEGLLKVFDEWLMEQEDQTIYSIRANVDNFMLYAKTYMQN